MVNYDTMASQIHLRKLAIMKIDAQLLRTVLSGLDVRRPSWAITKDALPDDAEIVAIDYNAHQWPQVINVVLASESFESVPPGWQIPTLPPVQMTAYYGPYDGSMATKIPAGERT
jgi:hypothetical protein